MESLFDKVMKKYEELKENDNHDLSEGLFWKQKRKPQSILKKKFSMKKMFKPIKYKAPLA